MGSRIKQYNLHLLSRTHNYMLHHEHTYIWLDIVLSVIVLFTIYDSGLHSKVVSWAIAASW
jgi:hypothetical protein